MEGDAGPFRNGDPPSLQLDGHLTWRGFLNGRQQQLHRVLLGALADNFERLLDDVHRLLFVAGVLRDLHQPVDRALHDRELRLLDWTSEGGKIRTVHEVK